MNLEEAKRLKDQLIADQEREGTLEVVLYGGPGVGKSTFRAEVFAALKKRGRNVEDVPEVAKDYTWEEATGKLEFQPLMMAKQMWKMRRLHNKVDALITDTSTLYSLIYGGPKEGVTEAYRDYILDDYNRRNTLNFLLVRNPNIPYQTEGRNQSSLEEAKAFDGKVYTLLRNNSIPFTEVAAGSDGAVEEVCDHIERILDMSTYSGFRPSGMSMNEWNAAGRPNLFNEFVKGETSTLEEAMQQTLFPLNGLVVTAKDLLEMPQEEVEDFHRRAFGE